MKSETYSMQEAARMCSIGKLKLFALLREKNIITKDNLAILEYRQKGFFLIHVSRWVHPIRGAMARSKTIVTPKGIELINKLIQEELCSDPKEYKKCS